MQLTYSLATQTDSAFVESLLLAGARKGQFNAKLVNHRENVRQDVRSMIVQQRLLNSPLYAEVMIYKVGQQRAGFSIMCGVTDFPNAIEIYALGVHKSFRGQGLGSKMLDELLHLWLTHRDVYAQCLVASEQMFQMLLHRHFECLFTLPGGARVLHCQQLPHRAQA